MEAKETLLKEHFERWQGKYTQMYNGEGILYLYFDDSGVIQQGHYRCMESFKKKHPNLEEKSHLILDLENELTEQERNAMRF